MNPKFNKLQCACVSLLIVASAGSVAKSEPSVVEVRRYPVILETLTGVSAKHAEMADYFATNSSKFPQAGRLVEVTVPFMVGMTSYSSLFCRQMIQDEIARPTNKRWIYESVDFNKPASQLLETGELPQLLKSMSYQFWGRDLDASESVVFQEEITSWLSGANGFGGSITDTLTATCSVFLSAIPVWME